MVGHSDSQQVDTGFLSNVVKGWYIVSRPGENEGDSTSWYASFFDFVSAYCTARFSDAWYFSPELSIRLHAGETTIPRQITVCTKDGSNNNLSLKFEASLFDLRVKDADFAAKDDIVVRQRLRLLSLPAALVRATPTLYTTMPVEMRIALSGIRDVSDVLGKLLEGGHSVVAGRIAGRFLTGCNHRNLLNDIKIILNFILHLFGGLAAGEVDQAFQATVLNKALAAKII